MFGIIHLGITLGILGIGKIKDTLEDIENKNKYYCPGSQTYIDHKGGQRDIHTNKQVYTTTAANGDRIVKDLHGNVIRNITEIKRQEEIAAAKRNGEKYINLEFVSGYDSSKRAAGNIYLDVNTNKKYGIRYINMMELWMDAETGELLRPTEKYLEECKIDKEKGYRYLTEEEIYKKIEELNKSHESGFGVNDPYIKYWNRYMR